MSQRQLFAKIGVFVLLGVNVGAYYMFWPHHDGRAKSETKSPQGERGEAQLLPAPPTKEPIPARPKEIPAGPLADAVPLNAPASAKIETKELSSDELAAKLLEHIRKEKEGTNPPVVVVPPSMPSPFDEKKFVIPDKVEIPVPPMFPDARKPKALPPLEGNPLKPGADISSVGVTSPLTPKTPPNPWTLTTETVGTQTLLLAKLRNTAEFRVYCDRVQSKPGGGEVVAEGNVFFSGAGAGVRCGRLTIPLGEARLIFEEQVVLTPSPGAGAMRSERIVWELPLNTPNGNATAKPGVLGPPD